MTSSIAEVPVISEVAEPEVPEPIEPEPIEPEPAPRFEVEIMEKKSRRPNPKPRQRPKQPQKHVLKRPIHRKLRCFPPTLWPPCLPQCF